MNLFKQTFARSRVKYVNHVINFCNLIHEADRSARSVVITISHIVSVRPSVRPKTSK